MRHDSRYTTLHDFANLLIVSVFVIEAAELTLPDDLISFIRLLLLSPSEYADTVKKEQLPKPKSSQEVLENSLKILTKRLEEYPMSIEVWQSPLQFGAPS